MTQKRGKGRKTEKRRYHHGRTYTERSSEKRRLNKQLPVDILLEMAIVVAPSQRPIRPKERRVAFERRTHICCECQRVSESEEAWCSEHEDE